MSTFRATVSLLPSGRPGSYTGTPAGPGPAASWNSADGGFAGAGITPISGVDPATSIAFSVDNNYGYYGGTDNKLLDDFATETGGATGHFSLANVPTGTYDVSVFDINGNFGGGSTAITLSSGTPDNGISTTNYPLANSDTSFVEGVNYVLFHGVVPASGMITGTYTAQTASLRCQNSFLRPPENTLFESG